MNDATTKVFLEGFNSKTIADSLRYMQKYRGFENIGSVKMVGKHRVILTMKEEYTDEDVEEILDQLEHVFHCGVGAKWGETNE
jgi:hypothetical protein